MPSTQTDRIAGTYGGLGLKSPVRVVTTANITLSGEQTIDGVACVDGDRVGVKNQTDAVQNGVYVVSTGTWTRAPDFDGAQDIRKGTLIFAAGGTIGGGLLYQVTSADVIVIGTSSITFSVLSNYSASAFVQTLLDDANAAAAQATLGLLIGTNTQAYDAFLTSIAALGTAADQLIYTTGVNTAAEAALTAFARTLLDDADAATARTTLGVPTAATQANQEAGSDTTVFVAPGRQHFHPSAAKAWVNFTGEGAVTINSSQNVTSVTDNGVGDYTVNFTTAFSSASYGFSGMCGRGAGSVNGENIRIRSGTAPTASAFRIETTNAGNVSTTDSNLVGLSFFGDFA